MRQDKTLNRIVAVADNGYPDAGKIGECWDPDASAPLGVDCGDGLAAFLANELASVRGLPYEDGLREAIRLVEIAERDLADVRRALEAALRAQLATRPLPGMEAQHG